MSNYFKLLYPSLDPKVLLHGSNTNLSQRASRVSLVEWIAETRNVGLILPRQSGKSSYLIDLHAKTSSKLFAKHTVAKGFNLDAEIMLIRGIKPRGFKLECILLDEYKEWPDGFDRYLMELALADMLADNFYVFSVCT